MELEYTSWSRRGADERAVLYVGDGPEQLGEFGAGHASVGQATWVLAIDQKSGATATADNGRVYALRGNLARDKELVAELGHGTVSLINERGHDWIIEDSRSEKIAQFSGGNNGVRRSILEMEPGHTSDLGTDEIAALSWFVRIILEARMAKTTMRLIITLVAATLLAILAFVM